MKYLKLDLNEFVKNAYQYDVDSLLDSFDYIDTSWIEVSGDEVEEARKKFKFVENLNDQEIEDVIFTAKSWTYERTYSDEYYEGVLKAIEYKIKEDFDKLNDFFSAYEEISVNGDLKVKRIDWSKNEIIFEGKISKLETYILNAINGYGMFHYDSLSEFRNMYSGHGIKERIESHLHWLKHMEDIYGTIYNFFRLDLSHVDYYGTLGHTDYEEEDLREALSHVA